jgi:hypothetical protein
MKRRRIEGRRPMPLMPIVRYSSMRFVDVAVVVSVSIAGVVVAVVVVVDGVMTSSASDDDLGEDVRTCHTVDSYSRVMTTRSKFRRDLSSSLYLLLLSVLVVHPHCDDSGDWIWKWNASIEMLTAVDVLEVRPCRTQ